MASVEGCSAWLMGGVAELLSGSWVASGRVLGGLGEVLGVMFTPKMAANLQKIEKKVAPRGKQFRSGFLMVFWSKISSQGDPNYVFELRNPNVKCISAFQHRHRVLFVLGANMAPC